MPKGTISVEAFPLTGTLLLRMATPFESRCTKPKRSEQPQPQDNNAAPPTQWRRLWHCRRYSSQCVVAIVARRRSTTTLVGEHVVVAAVVVVAVTTVIVRTKTVPHNPCRKLRRPMPKMNDTNDDKSGWFGRRPPPPPQKVVDPRLEETHHVRKHVADVKLPLWTSVLVVNRQLKKFAEKNRDKVSFFDATSMFTQVDAAGRTILQTDLISITGHPTKRGFDVWEEHVAQFALDTLVQLKKTTPELFPNNNKNTNTGGGDGGGEGGIDDYFLYQDDGVPSLNHVLSPDQLAQQDPAIQDDIYSTETDDFPSLPMTPHTDDA